MKQNIIIWSVAIIITILLCFLTSFFVKIQAWFIPVIAIMCTALGILIKHYLKKNPSKA